MPLTYWEDVDIVVDFHAEEGYSGSQWEAPYGAECEVLRLWIDGVEFDPDKFENWFTEGLENEILNSTDDILGDFETHRQFEDISVALDSEGNIKSAIWGGVDFWEKLNLGQKVLLIKNMEVENGN